MTAFVVSFVVVALAGGGTVRGPRTPFGAGYQWQCEYEVPQG